MNGFGICEIPAVLKIIYFIKTLINLVKFVVPIGLLVMVMLDMGKGVINGDKKISEILKGSFNKILAALIIFLLPTIVDFSLGLVTKLTSYESCWANANAIKIEEQQVLWDEEVKKREEEEKKQKEEERREEEEEAKRKEEEQKQEDSEKFFTSVGKYPIVPFGEHKLYTGLKVYKGDSLDNLLKKNGSSALELDKKIKTAVEYYGVGTRKATVAAAITLIGSIAETGYQLPYFWGGKWSKIGVNPDWGSRTFASSCNENYFDTQEEINACILRNQYWALDCSGFVNWAVIQGVQEVRSQSETNYGKIVNLESDRAVCNIGDALDLPGKHIALIVRLDDKNKRYIVAESSNGLELDSIPYGGPIGEPYVCVQIDDYID